MDRSSKLTLTGLIVVIVVVGFWILILAPILEKVRRIAMHVNCGTNLKGIGTAMTVYANDYEDEYPKLGKGTWSKELGYSYEDISFPAPVYDGACTITSSLYLLVREADVSPKSFICPWAVHEEFDGYNSHNKDIIELLDFGSNPHQHVSYAYHNPYGHYPPDGTRSAAFAVAADMNPWFENGNIIPPGLDNKPPQIITIPPHSPDDKTWQSDRDLWKPSNSINELPCRGPLEKKAKYAEGQNVLYADGHTAWEDAPNVGVKNDNIYTFWSVDENPTEQERQGGTAPTSRGAENDAKSEEDSFLGI